MDGALKKGVLILVVAFLGFYLFTDPHGLAALAKTGGSGLWHGLGTLFHAIIRFLNSLTG